MSDLSRYSRQIRFRHIGESGQRLIGASSVAIIGMGALGSVIAQHLVRSGVGFIRLVDRDFVEWSNLQRQMLFTERDAASLLPKAEAAAAHLRAINSSVALEAAVSDLTALNADALLSGVDLIIDGTDNFSARYIINDYSVKHGIPWIYGGAVGASGMTMTIVPGKTPCYQCLFPRPPAPGVADTCETAGVISPMVDIIGSIQATEAIKLLSGNREALHNTLFQIDLWNHTWLPIAAASSRRADCPACSKRVFQFLDHSDNATIAAALCGRNSVHLTPAAGASINLEHMAKRLASAGAIERNKFLLRLRLDKDNMTFVLFGDGRAIVQGIDDSTKARSIYSELLGI